MALIYRILALVLAVVVSITGGTAAPAQSLQGGKGGFAQSGPSATIPANRELEEDYFPQVSHTPLRLSEVEAELADLTDGSAMLQEAERLLGLTGDAANAPEVAAGYAALLEQYALADGKLTVATLVSDQDLLDTGAAQEVLYWQDAVNTLYDQLCLLGQEILDSPCASALEDTLSQNQAEFLGSYDSLADGPSAYSGEIAALCQEYDQAMAQDFSVEYQGRTWTWDSLSDAGQELTDADYYALYGLLYEAQDAVVGPIFLELVELRTAMAREAGYDSYLDYAYDWDYGRDLTPEEAGEILETVLDAIGWDLLSLYYDSYDLVGAYLPTGWDADTLLEKLRTVAGGLHGEIDEALDYLIQGNYAVLPLLDPAANAGGYTTMLPAYGAPVIYNYLDGTSYDITSMLHELGHYLSYYHNPYDPFFEGGFYMDVSEIHSTALEMLLDSRLELVFSQEEAARVRATHWLDLLYNLLAGTIVNQLEVYIYENPGLSTREISAYYAGLWEEYGVYSPEGVDYAWQDITHIFYYPGYYVSYALSTLAALEIWQACEADAESGLALYLELMTYSDDSLPLGALLEEVGLPGIGDAQYTVALAQEALDHFAALLDACQ